jgi:hypothetical protein
LTLLLAPFIHIAAARKIPFLVSLLLQAWNMPEAVLKALGLQ